MKPVVALRLVSLPCSIQLDLCSSSEYGGFHDRSRSQALMVLVRGDYEGILANDRWSGCRSGLQSGQTLRSSTDVRTTVSYCQQVSDHSQRGVVT
jgi:hypothetical protein